jgi:hypothetical protein
MSISSPGYVSGAVLHSINQKGGLFPGSGRKTKGRFPAPLRRSLLPGSAGCGVSGYPLILKHLIFFKIHPGVRGGKTRFIAKTPWFSLTFFNYSYQHV